VYEGVTEWIRSGPGWSEWKSALQRKVLAELARGDSPAWYDDDYDAVLRLMERCGGKARVEELILSAKSSNRRRCELRR